MTRQNHEPYDAAVLDLLNAVYMRARHGLALANVTILALDHLSEVLGCSIGRKMPDKIDSLDDLSFTMGCLASELDKVLTMIDTGEFEIRRR